MGVCQSIDDHEIRIREGSEITLEILFAIAHELRHAWQAVYYFSEYFADYLPRECFSNVDDYNKQPAEIDANAFAEIVMVDIFHRRPKHNGLNCENKKLIAKRIEEIIDEMGKI